MYLKINKKNSWHKSGCNKVLLLLKEQSRLEDVINLHCLSGGDVTCSPSAAAAEGAGRWRGTGWGSTLPARPARKPLIPATRCLPFFYENVQHVFFVYPKDSRTKWNVEL